MENNKSIGISKLRTLNIKITSGNIISIVLENHQFRNNRIQNILFFTPYSVSIIPITRRCINDILICLTHVVTIIPGQYNRFLMLTQCQYHYSSPNILLEERIPETSELDGTSSAVTSMESSCLHHKLLLKLVTQSMLRVKLT